MSSNSVVPLHNASDLRAVKDNREIKRLNEKIAKNEEVLEQSFATLRAQCEKSERDEDALKEQKETIDRLRQRIQALEKAGSELNDQVKRLEMASAKEVSAQRQERKRADAAHSENKRLSAENADLQQKVANLELNVELARSEAQTALTQKEALILSFKSWRLRLALIATTMAGVAFCVGQIFPG